MIAAERVVFVLLAAGRSERFRDNGSKLDQSFLGRPLGLHAAIALETIPFMARVAVVGNAQLDYGPHGFAVIRNLGGGEGLSSSIRLGVERAGALRAEAVLIALADMPLVNATHIYDLLGATAGPDTVVASSDGEKAKPPAVFGRDRFDALLALEGDVGARTMIRAGRHVVASPAELFDVDTPGDLDRLLALV